MLTLFVASVLACQALSAPLTDNGIANQELSISGNSTLSSSLIANGSIYAVQYDGREDQVELILITVDSASALTGTKLIGDKFVPAGDVSFTGIPKLLVSDVAQRVTQTLVLATYQHPPSLSLHRRNSLFQMPRWD